MASGTEASPPSQSPSLSSISPQSFRRLHRGEVSGPDAVRQLFELARLAKCELHNGVDHKSEPRVAQISWVGHDRLRLVAPNIEAVGQPQIYLRFDLSGVRYFFASPPIGGGGSAPLDLELPVAVYESERRDLRRSRTSVVSEQRVILRPRSAGSTAFVGARLRDTSYQGVGVAIDESSSRLIGDSVFVEFVDGERAGEQLFGEVVHRRPSPDQPGCTWLGLKVSAVEAAEPFPIEARDQILEGGLARRVWRRVALAGEMARSLPARTLRARAVEPEEVELEVVRYTNKRGQAICALIDRAGSGPGGTAVVIPPAWGRTKETFVALSRTIAASFEAAGESVTVLRFDGTNRRGESFIDPACRKPGDEHLRFTFSEAAADIEASFDFLEARPDIAPEKIVVVTFSLGSIEGRRAMANDAGQRTDGWVNVVGMADLQSGLRMVSGGVDYLSGLQSGVRFGHQELVGVVADIDFSAVDAHASNMVFLEDAKRDMAAIDVPVTWLHGRYDAWMEIERVQQLLAAGRHDNRKLIEIPAGHQMRSSREALETFQLVSSEVLRMALGREVEAALPDLGEIDRRMRAERSRRPAPDFDVSEFWHDYLLGRDRRIGFELMSATTAYRGLMDVQTEQLGIGPGHRILDLGSGTGDFGVLLAERGTAENVSVTQLDLVPSALARGRQRLAARDVPAPFECQQLAANLELDGREIPLQAESFDSVLASLMLSYVKDPKRLLCKVFDLIKPGGLLVISSMKRDADISRIYLDSIAELPPDRRRAHFGLEPEDFDALQRVFMNDAARLLQLEEVGRFSFWDREELAAMCESVGFEIVAQATAFGIPPQAVVITARRPLGRS